eukprot:CAMPEP_0197072844 /NCGR_PEP_ID=MMETSP1384-20130603/210301_1 /TAXON_ID=29189 /ORGANISM="Ammonia sp." /LENGTH=330 /DNA_ID=CAMNT_0042511665 /DNA_START=67 /DNA_END=1059 /DNA_ORIENTATION=-
MTNNHDRKVVQILRKVGMTNASKITDTLQGNIWRASAMIVDHSSQPAPSSVVIKVADRYLQENKLAKVGNQRVKVAENILTEAKIMQILSANKDCPASIVKFYQFFKTGTDFYLVMEDGGSSLFDFVVKAHDLIRTGKIELSHWQKVVMLICQQMVECIEYLHTQNICHLDISLENFLINDVTVIKTVEGNSEHIEFVTDDIQVKLCDFGLAQRFKDDSSLCSKYCGKPNYKSPEVVAKKGKFSAKKNDIWCVGVCLFMLSFGTAPWKTASPNDDGFKCISNGYLKPVLESWGIVHYASDDLIDLLGSIFQAESSRVSLDEIQVHAWLKK